MPVQETVDAAAELRAADFRLGAVVVNRARPVLVTDDQMGPGHRVDTGLLLAGLQQAGLPADGLADALGREVAEYAARLELQADNAKRLDEVGLPRIELPDLNPPVAVGELSELAVRFTQAAAGSGRRPPRLPWRCSAPRPADAPSCSPSTRHGAWRSRWA
jgi:hypothetical protein